MGVSPRLTDTNLRAPRREALGPHRRRVGSAGMARAIGRGGYRWRVARDSSRASTAMLALVAVARVGVGVVMVVDPFRFNREGSGTEALLMRTIGVRDLVLGSGACVAWASGGEGELRRWASMGLLSDGADLVTGLRSKPLVGSRSALIATLAAA